ncbi:MAG TPA: VWA domain-containing protein [Candidatus Binatia bacterium]|nr:VWA domain-containing protein [Candidatus Binatia bacterium]
MSPLHSPTVEIAPILEILRRYCHALAERRVDVQNLQRLIDKNIGWSRADVATSDGAAIFLPATIDRFDTEEANFEFLKVMLTQQAGHLEFGSFEFEFARPSTLFRNLREELAAKDDDDHEHHHDHGNPTDLTRYFHLFPDRRLAIDIFSIVESARVEAHVLNGYRGIDAAYRSLRKQALALRPEIIYLPAREALLELMVRASLGAIGEIKVPAEHEPAAAQFLDLIHLIGAPQTTVEDTAEATLRIYSLLAKIANDYFEDRQLVTIRIDALSSDVWRLEQETDEARHALPRVNGRARDYLSPQGVDYRGEFRPELAQLLTQPQANAREERKALTAEELADLLRSQKTPKRRDSDDEGEEQDPQIAQMVQNLMRELEQRDPRMQAAQRRASPQDDDDKGPLTVTQPNSFVYDEWDVFTNQYRRRWCKVYENEMPAGDLNFYRDTMLAYRGLAKQIRGEFEQIAPEMFRKEKRLPDGTDHDLDAAIEALTDLRIGVSPSEKIFWRQFRLERDVAVAFLLDMSGSTGESIGPSAESSQFSDDMQPTERSQRRIIDVEKEAITLLMDALEAIGDRYGVYGFSGHGRDHVEFYTIKGLSESFNVEVAKRLGRIGPLHATRMGPAIRHTTSKLREEQAGSKFLFLISDGRPQDRGYSQESAEKAYALHDTRMSLIEARREGVHPFCLTIDKEGNDYLRTMMNDFSYEVLADVSLLPQRLPQLYRKLTT